MCTLTLSSVAASSALADVWGVTPRAIINARYDSNVQLTTNDPSSAESAVVIAGVQLTRYSDTVHWSLEPQITLVRYLQFKEFDRDEMQIAASADKYYERGQITSTANYVRDTTVTSELGTSGLTDTNRPHEHIGFAFNPTLLFDQKWMMAAGLGWSTDRYPGAIDSSGLVDYDYVSASAQSVDSYSERSSIAIIVSYGRIVVPSGRYSTDQFSANLRWSTALTEQWNLTLAGGPLRVEADLVKDNGLGYSMTLHHQSIATSLDISLSRDAAPNGRGVLSKRNRAVVAINRNINDRWSTGLSTQWVDSQDVVPSIGFQLDAVRYLDLNAEMRWRATPTIAVSLSAGWTTQQREPFEQKAHGYRSVLAVSWQGLERGH